MSGDKTVMRAWTRAQSRMGRVRALPVVAAGLLSGLTAVGQAWCMAAILASVLVGPGGGRGAGV
ncbi:thiol reductant ABC exporter subunit CydD, partial [Nguyenibacter vanlangensis]|nr:thiol reductant ABC exporter subunit CydD [Nguyenibacter vanlangensis]